MTLAEHPYIVVIPDSLCEASGMTTDFAEPKVP